MKKTTFAIIVGNRGFFPDSLVNTGRDNLLEVLKKNGYGVVAPSKQDTKFGAVETFDDALKVADLFAKNSDKIDGIIVSLPNFGDEKGVAETVKRSGLNVPILIQAEPDIKEQMTLANRGDSFCGKISVCENLRQAGIPYTLTASHTVSVNSAEFEKELDEFASICRIVRGLQNVRFGQIGARTGPFNTVRYSEKILEFEGIAVEVIDLSEIFGQCKALSDTDKTVKSKLNAIKNYVDTKAIAEDALIKMAKFGTVVDRWAKANALDGTAVQCWTAMQEYYGIVPCTAMSMMSESLMPSACETDICGLLAMYILQLASQSPSALLDWNNNFGDDPDKCVLFHCSNLPISFFDKSEMSIQDIIGATVGNEKTCGTIVGRIKAEKATFFRTATDDVNGTITSYVGQGEFTKDKLQSFGGYGVMKIPNMQLLMQYICQSGFEHHVAVNLSQKADAIAEAVDTYLGWDVYRHI